MHVIYRISDNSYAKNKLPGTDKKFCLENFLSVFKDHEITVMADNCKEKTLNTLSNLDYISTNLGNAGSLNRAIKMACRMSPENIVYFVEDDYLHLPKSPTVIEEGLQLADYVTLYDHPDKYMEQYNFGETSKVMRTSSTHWRFTISTCMTFASKSQTIQEDIDIWNKWTNGPHPYDHEIFLELKMKGRKLAVPIPGLALHTDLTISEQHGRPLIEEWAIDKMVDHFYEEIPNGQEFQIFLRKIENFPKFDKLIRLSGYWLMINA